MRRSGKLIQELLQWSKFPVAGDGGDLEPTLQVVGENSLESLEHLINFSIGQVGYCREADVATYHQKKWNSVDDEDVNRQGDELVQVSNFPRDLENVDSHS